MFAFGGASTFPTVQADMADKKRFKWAAVTSCIALFAIYSSVMIVSYRVVHEVVHHGAFVCINLRVAPRRTESVKRVFPRFRE